MGRTLKSPDFSTFLSIDLATPLTASFSLVIALNHDRRLENYVARIVAAECSLCMVIARVKLWREEKERLENIFAENSVIQSVVT